MKATRVVIVDDHVMLRDGISTILQKEPDFEVVGEAGSVAEAVEKVQAAKPDLVLMDYGLPDGTGLDAAREILASNAETNIVLLTVHEEDDLLFAAIRSGAKGYLLKNISAQEMLAKLRGLAKGEPAMEPTETRRILSEFARTDAPTQPDQENNIALTDRELQVLHLIVKGFSNPEIGAKFHISVHTVKNHVHHILDKLQVSNRHEAADVAIKRGLVSGSSR
jgi:DNA-binding NarL/FixJ family response regulator